MLLDGDVSVALPVVSDKGVSRQLGASCCRPRRVDGYCRFIDSFSKDGGSAEMHKRAGLLGLVLKVGSPVLQQC
jgi:hypothetical protein